MSFRSADIFTGARTPQAGMVLLLCVIFLMSLTLLGLAASSDTIMQNKLTSNLQETERARQSALLALEWAEKWLLELDGPAPESCSANCTGLILHAKGDLPPHPESNDFPWWTAHGHEAGINPVTGERTASFSSSSIQPPIWLIEVVRIIPPAESGRPDLQVWYRILTRGSGRTDSTISVIESTIVRYWPSDESADAQDACPDLEETMACGRYAWRELR